MNNIMKKYGAIIITVIVLVILITMATISIIGESTSSEPGSNQTNPSTDDLPTDNNVEYQDARVKDKDATKVSINNFTEIVQNLPSGEQTLIETILLQTINWNRPSKDAYKITDATIRNGSYTQSYDSASQIYQTAFIVDIPSFKQSYQVTDKYSPLPPEKTKLYDYTALVLCPDESQLRYGEFDCIDRLKLEATQ